MVVRRLAVLTILFSCKGMDSDTDVPVDTDDTDLPVDTDLPEDTDETDVPVDTDVEDTDLPEDTDVEDTDDGEFHPDLGCYYIDILQFVTDCSGNYTTFFQMTEYGTSSYYCPDYYTDGYGHDYLDAADLLASQSCEDDCVYVPATAVMVLYCDSRGEYIDFRTGGPGQSGNGAECPPLIHADTIVGSDWAPSWEAFQASYPCP